MRTDTVAAAQQGPRVRTDRTGAVATISLSRADKRNAMDERLLGELYDHVEGVVHDPDLRVIVLTGSGSVFSAGADLSGLKSILDPIKRKEAFAPTAAHLAELIRRVVHLLVSTNKATIASINGHAIGGGWITALACDFRVSVREAEYWFPEIGLGRAIGEPTIDTLLHYVGPLQAKEIALTARRYSAQEALEMSLLTRVCAASDLQEAVATLAARLAASDSAALARVKSRMNQSLVSIWSAAC